MIHPVWNPFSQYADRMEKRVDRLLWRVAFLGVIEAQKKMLLLMQENLVVVSLWLEARFKGYKYLKKSVRKKMYQHTQRISQIFLEFADQTKLDNTAITRNLNELKLSVPQTPDDWERLRYIVAITLFLHPNAGRYDYLEGASFGKLLSDPDRQQKMIGDCNQIVTFYTFLYSLKYNINELQIKIMEGHVCLHFKGIDIEATSGGFANYKEFLHLLPIVEIISTNLLDVSDFRDKQIKVDPHNLLKSAHLANNLSSEKGIVSHNLQVAYHNVAIETMKSGNYEMAIFFAQKAGVNDPSIQKLLNSILRNAIIDNVKGHNFKKARYYYAMNQEEDLKKYLDDQEGMYEFNSGSLTRARELFRKSGNEAMIKACYSREYNEVQKRVAGLNDLSLMKSHRSEYKKLLELAQKMGDSSLENKIRDLLSKL
jgi:hypothetical protein